jgi:hypothetical protein
VEWLKWVFIAFFSVMLALLVYSIVSTSNALRKKTQPSLDAFFDGLSNMIFRRHSSSARDRSDNDKRQL